MNRMGPVLVVTSPGPGSSLWSPFFSSYDCPSWGQGSPVSSKQNIRMLTLLLTQAASGVLLKAHSAMFEIQRLLGGGIQKVCPVTCPALGWAERMESSSRREKEGCVSNWRGCLGSRAYNGALPSQGEGCGDAGTWGLGDRERGP